MPFLDVKSPERVARRNHKDQVWGEANVKETTENIQK